MTTRLPRTLAKAYRDTDFIVRRADKDIILRVGSPNRRLHPLLKEFNCETWSFVTASNPGSRALSRTSNNARNRRLRREVTRLGYRYLRGHGQPRTGDWPAEESILVLGIAASEARKLGGRHGQLAIVWGRRGSKARLLRCD